MVIVCRGVRSCHWCCRLICTSLTIWISFRMLIFVWFLTVLTMIIISSMFLILCPLCTHIIHKGHEKRNIKDIMTINSESNYMKINVPEEIQIVRAAKSANILNDISGNNKPLYRLLPPADRIQIIMVKLKWETTSRTTLQRWLNAIERPQGQPKINLKTEIISKV